MQNRSFQFTRLFAGALVVILTACSPVMFTPEAPAATIPAAATPADAASASNAVTTTTNVSATNEVSATSDIIAGTGITTSTVGLANPASRNCVAQGGTLSIEQRGDGGEFGVCVFEDNLQCEEWAMLRDECPMGGIKVTGFLTPAARYCAITGGTYEDNGTTSADDEQDICNLAGGTVCAALDYYNGQCLAE